MCDHKGFIVAVLNAIALIVFADIGDKTEGNLESVTVNVTHLSRGSQWIRPITCGLVRLRYMIRVFESEGSVSRSVVTKCQS